jgi:hypothetical protein
MRKLTILFMVVTLVLAFGACAVQTPQGSSESTLPPAPSASPTEVAITSPEAQQTVAFFPVQRPEYEGLAYPAALTFGVLVLENGYLRLRSPYLDVFPVTTQLVIWPPGSALQITNGVVEVVNYGRTIARVGEKLEIGGGQVPEVIVTKYTGESIPSDCPGPYWLAAPGIYNTPRPAPPNGGPTPPVIDDAFRAAMEKEPLLLEATMYAQRFGISVDEALKRLKMQDAPRVLQNVLEQEESATFGGLWLQHEPDFRIVVAFTRDGEETMKKYAGYIAEETMPYVEVRTVRFSLAEMKDAQLKMIDALRNLDIASDSGVYVIDNNVGVNIAESVKPRIESLIQSGELVVPECVRIIYVKGLAKPD